MVLIFSEPKLGCQAIEAGEQLVQQVDDLIR